MSRLRRRSKKTEAGYVAILISIMVPTLFLGLSAVGVDTAQWYLEGERVQKAADAAALAGVPFLPQDLSSATARAKEVAKRNGYDDASASVKVTVTQDEARDSQLRVSISSTIVNQFGQYIGVDRATIGRTAVADYSGPAPMGSPCNAFGNEPSSGSKGSYATGGGAAPTGSVLGDLLSTPNCTSNPQMWAMVEGPETGKVQGDRYGTLKCEDSGVDKCNASKDNEEYDERGYFWLIKVEPEMVNKDISLQLYDPAMVVTGQACESLPQGSDLDEDMNPYVRTDGKKRYGRGDNASPATNQGASFCTGDSFAGNGSGASSEHKMTTSFVVRQQTDSQNPMLAPVQNSTAGTPCAKQYGARHSVPTKSRLKSSNANYVEQLAKVFHNWTELCTFKPERAGDYYLHVRTNVSYNFSGSDLIRDVPSGSVSSLLSEDGDDDPYGEGSNAFGIRAVVPAGLERKVAVSGWDRMPIYANASGATSTFNLIRILPGAAGQFISFSFFDAGDAAGTGSVKVQLPTDAKQENGSPIATKFPGGCTAVGGSAGSGEDLTDCSAPLRQHWVYKNGWKQESQNNGKIETVSIPIPTDYWCDATVLANCWYQVKVDFADGSVHDVTTWDAEIVGDPVRLIE